MPFAPSASASPGALLLAASLLAAPVAAAGADAPAADILLRKSFRPGAHAAAPAPSALAGATAGAPAPGAAAAAPVPVALRAAVEALGATLFSAGTLHLPDIDGRMVVLDAAATPLVEVGSGRTLIIDAAGAVAEADARGIAGRWPAYSVLRVDGAAGVADLLGRVLDASGFASVLRGAPLTFGGAASVRIVPDYFVLAEEEDLLRGETRAVSVLEAEEEALPAELRRMAQAHRILVVELLDRDGRPARDERGWRDPTGAVTTVAAADPALILAELAGALGIGCEREGGRRAALRLRRGANTATVITGPAVAPPGSDAVLVSGPADLPGAIGPLFRRLGVTAVGPAVEFRRPARGGRESRFTITVSGWLADHGGRRLLVTAAELPAELRLFLTREGIDLFSFGRGSRR